MFFKKNSNEQFYTGGKKHWTNVIKNTGDADLLLWRQLEEDFNTNSTLIVLPGERAIFVDGGQIVQVFDAGIYQLSTENYPFISRLRNAFSGGVSVFNCLVYFVRDASGFEIKWGTDSPIQVRDKVLGMATKLKARGAYKIRVSDPVAFLEKYSGNKSSLDQLSVKSYFCEEFLTTIKSQLSTYFQAYDGELLGIDAHLEDLSRQIEPSISEKLTAYGIELQRFSVSGIDIAEDHLRSQFDQVGMEAFEKVKLAQADKAVLDTLGNDWMKMQQVDIMKTMAQNGGGGLGADLAAGLGSIGVFSKATSEVFEQPQISADDPIASLEKLKKCSI